MSELVWQIIIFILLLLYFLYKIIPLYKKTWITKELDIEDVKNYIYLIIAGITIAFFVNISASFFVDFFKDFELKNSMYALVFFLLATDIGLHIFDKLRVLIKGQNKKKR